MSEVNDEVELIRSNKGGLKLIHRGYMYTVHKKRQSGGIRWRCSQRSLHCKGSISTGDGPPKVNMPHNHIPDPHSVALARCRQFEEFAELTPMIEMDCDDSEENVKRKRLAKKVTHNNDDFVYEIERLDDMFDSSRKPPFKDYSRVARPESSPKLGVSTPPPVLSPNLTPSIHDKNTKEADAEEVCLRWNSHHSNMKSSFPSLLQREQYVDVTLTSEGKSLKCHRLILSSCSAYFDELLSGISPLQHPVIFLNGVSFWILKCLIDFMYAGEVHIEQNKLESLLKVAEMLQIKGLTGKSSEEQQKATPPPPPIIPVKTEKPVAEQKHSPAAKRDSIATTSIPAKSPPKKLLSPTLVSPIDPLSLLEPTFFEENPIPLKFKEHVAKKVIPKKIKKRKLSEHEPSPPPILYRKGTKSRPHVKVPRYYHNDYEDLDGKKTFKKEEPPINTDVPDTSRIKIEPLDIEETDVQFSDKRKLKDSPEKVKPKKQIPDKKVESNEESISKEAPENTSDDVELIEKEIKQEKIDLDYIDVGTSENHNVTV